MRAFATLVDALIYTPSRNGKLRLMIDYFRHAADPDRGWALAALTGALAFDAVKAGAIRALCAARVDEDLFRWSYDFVGDLAETAALIWPGRPPGASAPSVAAVVDALRLSSRAEAPRLLESWLDDLGPEERFALLKLVTGNLRVGVSARLAKTALADYGAQPLEAVEEVWHALAPPYAALFAWLEGRAERPATGGLPTFRPLMLANPIEEGDLETLDPQAFRAEWKWDGIRVQIVALGPGTVRLYSRAGDEIGAAFPDVVDRVDFHAVLDGELLVMRAGAVAPFNDLQQRLNRKGVTAKMRAEYPAWIRLYDILQEGEEDLRGQPFDTRRARLEAWVARTRPAGMDLSPLIPFRDWDSLAELRAGARAQSIEGLMLKRADGAYVSGRPKGLWWKWKRGALVVDAVMMYAQRGHGKRSSFYSDYTFGLWRPEAGGEALVPVGKAYSGFTDEELLSLDRWVRNHTTNRFGPVREVAVGLVLEVAFDSVHPSGRHKSGVAMRFPRIHRIRWDKPAAEADRLAHLVAMIT
jgi:DNA ligase-1